MNRSPISNSLFLPEAGKGLRPAAVRNRGTRFAHFADKKLALGHMKMVTELICK